MISIREQDLGARIFERLRKLRLDRGLCSDRHEEGRLDGTVQCLQPAAPGGGRGIGLNELKVIGHL